MIFIHLPTDYVWKVWYGSRTTCAVYTETVAPLHDHWISSVCKIAHRLSAHVQQWNACVKKHMALFYRNYGRLTVGTLTPSITYKIWDCMLERVCKKPIRDLAQLKQRLMEVSADFEQTIVDKWTSGENDSGPVLRPKDSTLTPVVTCDAAHSLNRHTVLNDYRFCQHKPL